MDGPVRWVSVRQRWAGIGIRRRPGQYTVWWAAGPDQTGPTGRAEESFSWRAQTGPAGRKMAESGKDETAQSGEVQLQIATLFHRCIQFNSPTYCAPATTLVLAGLKRSEQLLQDLYFPYSAADIGAEQYQATFAVHTQTNK